MIFDVESDGLLDEATKIHVLAYEVDGKVHHTHDYEEMRRILTSAKLLIGHNIILYDIPLVEKLLNIKVKARLIDTLPLSWYLNHNRVRHGLEVYGEEYGVPKPVIDNWESLTPEEYAHRCREDVKINLRLWTDLRKKLLRLYSDKRGADRLIKYLTFKMDCVREQERSRWKVDLDKVRKSLGELYLIKEEKVEQLKEHMPPVQKYRKASRPKKPFTKSGDYSAVGARWFKHLRDLGLPEDYDGEIQIPSKVEPPNPGSSDQVKDWLFTLGWVPASFDYKKNEDGSERKVPQVRVLDGDRNKVLCPSVLRLVEKHPEVELLDGLTVVSHRISVLEGFLKSHKNGWLQARVNGLTNTLRFKHKELVNLPGAAKPFSEAIRGSLIAPEGHELCGSDMCSLESNTKRHYMYPHDPSYVEEMSKPGFDEHLDLAKLAGRVTQEQIDNYNKGIADVVKKLKPVRGLFKPANYAGIYGVREKTLSRQTGMPEKQCKELLDIYWKRNWSVKKIAQEVEVKKVDGEMWLFNPVSQLWYSLRYEKDIFSTLNQGTGVFCFDSWVRELRNMGLELTAQMHDEIIVRIKRGDRERTNEILKEAILKVNNILKLNVDLDVDVQFGDSYAEIH
jgi:hypothetical protein